MSWFLFTLAIRWPQ